MSISQHFTGLAAKRLMAGELDHNISNQHEFNGVNGLKEILGDDAGKTIQFPTSFIYLGNDESSSCQQDSSVSWYDSRRNHPTRSEYRLYYQANNEVIERGRAGDLIVFARKIDGSLLAIITEAGSTSENQVCLLFGLSECGNTFVVKKCPDPTELGFAGIFILDQIGVDPFLVANERIAQLVRRFGNKFPLAKEFSEFARASFPLVTSVADPDKTILAWMEREELFFRAFERHFFKTLADTSHIHDFDKFMALSLSFHNRRKARAGQAFENHLEAIFTVNGLTVSRSQATEGRSKPDFLFPSVENYRDPAFPAERLTLLAAKTSCKDRWRQVLSEGLRIARKHLVTLEPAISVAQTAEMERNQVQLVMPLALHSTFNSQQRTHMMTVKDFIKMVHDKNIK